MQFLLKPSVSGTKTVRSGEMCACVRARARVCVYGLFMWLVVGVSELRNIPSGTFRHLLLCWPKQKIAKKKIRKSPAPDIVLTVGTRIDGLFDGRAGGELWYPGRITKVHANGTYDVAYDDGDVESELSAKYIHYVSDSEDESAGGTEGNSSVAVDASTSNVPTETPQDAPDSEDQPADQTEENISVEVDTSAPSNVSSETPLETDE